MKTWSAEDIRELRGKYEETREMFRQRLNVALNTLRDWEQGVNIASGPVLRLFERLEEDIEVGEKRQVSGLQLA